MRLKVRDVMTADPVTVAPDLPFKEVADVLIEKNIGGVPVVDATGAVLGVITETDLIDKPAYGHLHHEEENVAKRLYHAVVGAVRHKPETPTARRTAKDIMTSPAMTAAPYDDVEVIGRKMLKNHIGRLPVLQDGKLVGIISRRDLVRQFHHSDAQIASDVEKVLGDPLLSESNPEVTVVVDDGIVVLRGTVRYEQDAEALTSLVAGVGGVVDIRNEVTAAKGEPDEPAPGVPFEEPAPRYY